MKRNMSALHSFWCLSFPARLFLFQERHCVTYGPGPDEMEWFEAGSVFGSGSLPYLQSSLRQWATLLGHRFTFNSSVVIFENYQVVPLIVSRTKAVFKLEMGFPKMPLVTSIPFTMGFRLLVGSDYREATVLIIADFTLLLLGWEAMFRANTIGSYVLRVVILN